MDAHDPDKNFVKVIGLTKTFRNFMAEVEKERIQGDDDEFLHAVNCQDLAGLKPQNHFIVLLPDCHMCKEWNAMFPIIRYMKKTKKVPIMRAKIKNNKWEYSEYTLL